MAVKVLHYADCPLLTGVHIEKGAILEATAPRKIVCAVDLHPQSSKALAWADQMAEEFHSQLIVGSCHAPGESHSEETFNPEWRFTVKNRIRERLSELTTGLHVSAAPLIESGNPAEIVAEAAQQFNADLVAIGRSEAAGIFGRLCTKSYAIIRQSPCPVVSV